MKNDTKGFTLIEMAIVLVVMGLIVGTIVPLLVTQSKTARLKEARDILRTARDEIIGYAYQYGCLPNSTDLISTRKDPWGKEIFYRAAYNGTGESLICTSHSNDPCEEVICNSSNTTLTIGGDESYNNVAFVVASGGPNHNKQFDWDFNDATKVGQLTTYAFGKKIDSYGEDFDRSSDEYDDLVEYMDFWNLKRMISNLCMSDPPSSSDISFKSNIAEFDHIIQSQDGVIRVVDDEDRKTITMGGTDELTSGCIWYGENTGPCSDGVCDLGSGFRAFFKFKSTKEDTSNDSTDYASGFTFAVTSDTESPAESVCGGNGAHLGYAGTQPDHEYWIGEPKMGVEVDYYKSNSENNDWCFNKDDPNGNHVAALFWGYAYAYLDENGGLQTTDEDICEGAGGEGHNGDDNRHGAGELADFHSKNLEKNSAGCAYEASNKTWLEDAQEHTLRIDLGYNASSGNTTISAWVDVEGSNAINKIMSEEATVTAQMTIEPELFREQMEKIRFGWTVGSSDEQAVKLSDFRINFLDYNSTNST
ncbi:type II secretion system protein [Desulfoplanes sp.]